MANIVTCIRILCAALLLPFPAFSKWFYLFYVLGGISDALDGFIARHYSGKTAVGAKLDTAADIVFVLAALIKVLNAVYFPPWLIVWIIVIALIKCANVVIGFIRYRHFVAEHTILNKICGILLFFVPLCIGSFPWQAVAVLVITVCAAATVAAVQEGYYILKGKEIR